MKVADLAGLIVLAIVVIVGLGFLTYWALGRRAGVNRRELARVRAERKLLSSALASVEDAIDQYRDIESPLAAAIRTIIRDTREKRENL